MVNGQRAALTTTEAAVIANGAQLIPFGVRVGSGIGKDSAAAGLRPYFVLSPARQSLRRRYDLFTLLFRSLAFFLGIGWIGLHLKLMPIAPPSAGIVRVALFIPYTLLCSLCFVLTRAGLGHFFRALATSLFNALTIRRIALVNTACFGLHFLAVLRIGLVLLFALIIRTRSAPSRTAIAGLFGRWEVV